MSIPESQLSTWSNLGGVTAPSSAYDAIDRALAHEHSPVRYNETDIYLQGSYRNVTNIYGDSDVDIVVQSNSAYYYDVSALSFDQLQLFNQNFGSSSYTWNQFHTEVITALQRSFGSNVSADNKSIKVKMPDGRMYADVVPALQYRKYKFYFAEGHNAYTEGIKFFDSYGNEIINYPKEHIKNGQSKNSQYRTNGWYKPTVRIFKNAKSYLVDNGKINKHTAPSYFIECLLYNVPDENFTSNHQQTVVNVLNHCLSVSVESFICQNGIVPLIGNSSTQWDTEKKDIFLGALLSLWSNW